MLSARLVGHEIWVREIVAGIRARGPADITVVGHKDLSEQVRSAIGEDCHFVAGIGKPHLKGALGKMTGNPKDYFEDRMRMAKETARLVERFADADLHIFATAVPTVAAGVAMAQKRAKNTSMVFHFSHEELADKAFLEQYNLLCRFRELARDTVSCFTTCPGLAAELQELGIRARVAPYPFHAGPRPPVTRRKCRRIGLLGQQRKDKDGGLIWPLVGNLLTDGFDVVLHDSRGLSSVFRHPALTHVNKFLPSHEFAQLLQTCDLTIITNEPKNFSHRISGVSLDALASAVPIVVPDNTHMSRLVRRFNAGTVYDERTPNNVYDAVTRAKLHFADYANGALQAASWLKDTGGYTRLANTLLNGVGALE